MKGFIPKEGASSIAFLLFCRLLILQEEACPGHRAPTLESCSYSVNEVSSGLRVRMQDATERAGNQRDRHREDPSAWPTALWLLRTLHVCMELLCMSNSAWRKCFWEQFLQMGDCGEADVSIVCASTVGFGSLRAIGAQDHQRAPVWIWANQTVLKEEQLHHSKEL